MKPVLVNFVRDTPLGRDAAALLRACVHCGACAPTCPTFQLLGDELDSPRGRIYQMKMVLEGRRPATRETLAHLDRCLGCRTCEAVCASGMHYAALLDIGRVLIEGRVARPWRERVARALVRSVIPHPGRFTPLLRLGQLVRPLMPTALKRRIPARRRAVEWPASRHARRMLVLDGCVQPAIAPNINAAAARVLDRLGISLVRAQSAGCCGALHQHTSDPSGALDFARRNIDAWWPHVEAGCEAIVTTASGCGLHVKEYGHLLRGDPTYAARAKRVSQMARDLSEVVAREDLGRLEPGVPAGTKVAFQSPCSLQHGQRLNGVVEKILSEAGFVLTEVPDRYLCCGSAGSYALLQPGIASRLKRNKVAALESARPDLIASANIGCLVHLQSGTDLPVRHWIELFQLPRGDA
ncbi:glycolate oxidase iron-sulfur subunit [Sulfurifustis variabilis]|uniref:Glycolate oxidase iron-sulfur subunit n=1 Tax=Sulfurifustis variabilis TaxID=1675686 RepID=A0A1B4VCG7_9GAMM|nr:glycolate oxidase subunit GlcF [Sulfurifustis variabilis]BAU49241.1 glycolate oxidase iron-sulfur subunit [Sulfurifustis variabilis]